MRLTFIPLAGAAAWVVCAALPVNEAPEPATVTRPQGAFGRCVLTLNQGFIGADGAGAEALILHLPCRAGRFAPQGWCVEPGDNVIAIVETAGLALSEGRLDGKIRVIPWEAGVTREYELTGTVGPAGAAGTFALRQTAPGRAEPLTARGAFTGRLIAEAELARGNDLASGKQYPMWRGPAGSGNVDSGRKLVLSAANARLVWLSEDLIPHAAWNIGTKGLSGGCDNPSVEDGRVYLVYYVPSGDVLARDVSFDRFPPEYTRETWRLHWLVEADDVVHCFDARTGATLWKTVFRQTGLNTNARVPGLKTTPHRTVCVAGGETKGVDGAACVADGRAFAVGSAGDLFCLNARTGEEIWRSALPRSKKIGDELRKRSIAERFVCGMGIHNGHPVYADGTLVCADTGGTDNGRQAVGFVQGFDAATGRPVWTFGLEQGFYMGPDLSVNLWRHKGRAYVIAAGPRGVACLDPKTGKAAWRIEEAYEGGGTTVALGDDTLLTSGRPDDTARTVTWERGSFPVEYRKTPMRCYRLTPEGATRVWERPAIAYAGRCTPLIRAGHVYIKAGGNVNRDGEVQTASSSRRCSIVCIELETGKIVATATEVPTCEHESYVGGDGFASHGWGLGRWEYDAFRASPTDLGLSAPLQLPRKPHYYGWCSTPAYADGRLFIRTWDRMACYDLRLDERLGQAAEAMDRGNWAAALRSLVEATRNDEASVRREAAAGLGAMGEKAVDAFDGLVAMVRDDVASSVRAAAAAALSRVSRSRPERLIALVRDGDHPNVRTAAAAAVGDFDPAGAGVVDAEAHALADPAPGVRRAALKALGDWGGRAAAAAPELANVLRDRDIPDADAAVQVLRSMGEAGIGAAPVLIQIVKGGHAERRERAAAALAAIGRPAVLEVAKRTTDPDSGAAIRFMGVLGAMGATAGDAVPALGPALRAEEWPRAAAAAAALVAIDPAQEGAVIAALTARMPGARTNVFAECAMRMAGIAKRTQNEAIRNQVVGTLSRDLQIRLAGDALLTEDASLEFKRSLVRALGAIGPSAAAAAPVLRKAFEDRGAGNEAAAAWQKVVPDQPQPKPKMEADAEPDL